jgi:hypothetical protein
MNDRDIEQLLDAWIELGPNAAPARVAEAARLEARSTRQTMARRFFAVNTMTRVAAAAALAAVGVGVVLAFGALGPDVGDMPTPTPTPQATLPDISSPQSVIVSNQQVQTSVDFSLPGGDLLQIVPNDLAWKIDIRDQAGSWGIRLADITGATNHTDRFTREPIPAGDAATFLDALDASTSYVVSNTRTSTIDGRSALTATIRLEEGAEDDHLDVEGEGGFLFDTPNTTSLVDIDGAIFVVQVWAGSETDLAANRLLADSILASLRFGR